MVLGLIYLNEVYAKPSNQYVLDSIDKAADKENVPRVLLRSICRVESNLDPEAFRYTDGGKRNHAIGICQILVTTAAEEGMLDKRCHNDFRKKSKSYQDCKLFGPFTHATYAARYLKKKLLDYDGSWIYAIAAYNTGSVKKCSRKGYYISRRRAGRIVCVPGELINYKYVELVKSHIKRDRNWRKMKKNTTK